MSDFLDKIVDTHLDRLPSKFKWYLLIGSIVLVVFLSSKNGSSNVPNIDLTEYHHVNYNPTGYGVAENIGGGSSGNNVSGVILQ